MTSRTGKRLRIRRAGAFSLLEMVVSLAIIAILTGYFMVRFSESQEEQLLSPPSSQLRLLSQRALRQASAYREEYTMVFTQSAMALVRGRGLGGEVSEGEVVESIAVPGEVAVLLRLAGGEKWVPADGDTWYFRPGGLCEPIEVRFESGEAFVELAFDPLTARAEETAYYP